jgi:hypothetical protein
MKISNKQKNILCLVGLILLGFFTLKYFNLIEGLNNGAGAGGGGRVNSDGSPSGRVNSDGSPPGRAPSGGAPSGGAPSGGAPSGGAPPGGAPSGGAPSGGAPPGGAPSGGAPSGGAHSDGEKQKPVNNGRTFYEVNINVEAPSGDEPKPAENQNKPKGGKVEGSPVQ